MKIISKYKINIYFVYTLIYMCYYTNLPIKLEEITMCLFLIWSILNKKIFRIKFNLKMVFVIIILGTLSLIQGYKNDYPINRILEQVSIILVMYLGYDQLFKKYGYKNLFYIYFRITYFVCLLGLVQFIFYFIFKVDIFSYPVGSNSRMIPVIIKNIIRIRSVAYEPGWLAQTMLPAVIYSIEVLISSKRMQRKYIIVILVFFMTMSSGAMIVLPIYFIITRLKSIKDFFLGIGLIWAIGYLTKNIWSEKLIETISGLAGLKTGVFLNLNASSFAILSNLYVALNNNNLLLGVGLGNHPYSYYRNFKDLKIGVYHFYGLNSMDAYSLFSRIISELGLIFGISCLIILIIKRNKNNNLKALINNCSFIAILSFFLRGGLYTRFGTTFIILLFVNTISKKRRKM